MKKPKFAGTEVVFLRGSGTSGLGGRRTETLWSELRIGRNEKTRAEFWRRELSQKLFDYETGGKFAPELRPVLKDVGITPEQIVAFSADENEYLAEEFKGAIVELDDQITNAQDWQIIAYGDAFYAAAPGGGGTNGVSGVAQYRFNEDRATYTLDEIAETNQETPALIRDLKALDVGETLDLIDAGYGWGADSGTIITRSR
jgi:hypothetical protein